MAADDFFLGLYETALEPGELLTAVEIPVPEPGSRHAFGEVARRHGDYALAGLALTVGPGRAWARAVFFGIADRPVRGQAAEAAIVAGGDAAAVATEGIEVAGDPTTDAATRRHLAGVLLRRALARLERGA